MLIQINLMYRQRRNGPIVWVKKGCLNNLPKGCEAVNTGTWNTRTLFRDFKLENLLAEIIRLKIDIIGVSETHWTKETPEAFEQNGYVIIQSPRLYS